MARPASDIAERIVRAARERFLVEGVEGASLRAIARDAGTSLGMVYYYYPTKDDLFLACIEGVYAALLDNLAAILSEPTLETQAVIGRFYARLSQLSHDELMVVRLVLREAIGESSQRMAKLFERFSRGHLPLIAGLLQRGMARGELRTDLPLMLSVLATALFGVGPQLLRRRLAESGVQVDALLPAPDAMGVALAKLLFEGIAARPAALQEAAPVEKRRKPKAKPA
jgi:AcrR family transcriptional regulator